MDGGCLDFSLSTRVGGNNKRPTRVSGFHTLVFKLSQVNVECVFGCVLEGAVGIGWDGVGLLR